jgi:hypothetical protein
MRDKPSVGSGKEKKKRERDLWSLFGNWQSQCFGLSTHRDQSLDRPVLSW